MVGQLFFDREGIAFLNDTNFHVYNLYQQLAKPESFAKIMAKVDVLRQTPEHLKREYYHPGRSSTHRPAHSLKMQLHS